MNKEPESNAWKKRKKMAAEMLEKIKTKTVTIEWTEFHNFEAEIEIPENLSGEEALDWVMMNTDTWGMDWREPYDINTDWDTFEIVKEP